MGCPLPQTPVVDGDALSSSIAAASIMAKVTRDSLMEEYAQLHPGYSFERHKGYGTAGHIDALGGSVRCRCIAFHSRPCG